ncbi:brix domain-containing protein F44G4.1-like isoform X2 [Triticum dicoccoides]|uniref:brix domain-containing protein F44G4.1-like isoform X2 n=1 Tax=Triticum dicoccoides TaxID=85692 RepID=UPI00188E612F|nr:brix domain-containing protein F44G4.1-like isoform X2 [Triticum dicoccoides]
MVLTAKQEEVVNAEAGKKRKQSPEEDEGQSRGAKPLGTRHMEKSEAEIQVLPKGDNVDGKEKKKKGKRIRRSKLKKDRLITRAAQRNMFGSALKDEFPVLKDGSKPKVLITACQYIMDKQGPSSSFIHELMQLIPDACYIHRTNVCLDEVVEYANERKFTSLIVALSDGLKIINLPDGPLAHLELSEFTPRKDIKNHGEPISREPELVFNNFEAHLGYRLQRLISSLFPQADFNKRQVFTFELKQQHILFRNHRYLYEMKEELRDGNTGTFPGVKLKASDVTCHLLECGPRFTLRLTALECGLSVGKKGKFEWHWNTSLESSEALPGR